MKYCEKCGAQLEDSAVFCSACGNKIVKEESQSKTIKEGDVYKCPYCGEFLPSDVTYCPTCKHELRGKKVISSVKDFYEKYTNSVLDSEKYDLIKMFPIPNNKEDIREFMIIGTTNFDLNEYISKRKVVTISSAWLAKIDECYSKALMLLEEKDLKPITIVYNEFKAKIDKAIDRKKKGFIAGLSLIILGSIGIFLGSILFPTNTNINEPMGTGALIMVISLGVLAIGIVIMVLTLKRKKSIREIEKSIKDKDKGKN